MEPPLDPSSDEAREWAEDELAKSIYDTSPSLLDRILMWLFELFESLAAGGTTGAVLLPVFILLLAALVVGIALLIGGPVRRRRLRTAASSTEVLDADDDRSAEALLAAADAAAARGDFATAILERFRSLVRSLDDRTILTDRQGRTAHESAVEASAAFPTLSEELLGAGSLFDSVRYGSARSGADDDAWLAELLRTLRRTKPVPVSQRLTRHGWAVSR